MRKSTLVVACCLLAAALAIVDIAPFVLLLPIPRTDAYTGGGLLLLAACGGGVGFLTTKLETYARRAMIMSLVIAAVANVLTAVSLHTLPPLFLSKLISGSFASLFSLDGEYADIADGYELWCKVWLALAAAACLIAWSIRRMAKPSSE
jgi:hypothetical protein